MPELPAEEVIARRMLQEGIDTLLADNNAKVTLVATAINNYLAKAIKKNGKVLIKIGDVILNNIAQKTVDNDNRIDLVKTAILGGIAQKIDTSKAQLDYLAGLTGQPGPGDPVVLAAAQNAQDMPELAVTSAIGLAVDRMADLMDELVEVLAEIRDRMPGVAIRLPGELPVTREKAAVVADDDETFPEPTEETVRGAW